MWVDGQQYPEQRSLAASAQHQLHLFLPLPLLQERLLTMLSTRCLYAPPVAWPVRALHKHAPAASTALTAPALRSAHLAIKITVLFDLRSVAVPASLRTRRRGRVRGRGVRRCCAVLSRQFLIGLCDRRVGIRERASGPHVPMAVAAVCKVLAAAGVGTLVRVARHLMEWQLLLGEPRQAVVAQLGCGLGGGVTALADRVAAALAAHEAVDRGGRRRLAAREAATQSLFGADRTEWCESGGILLFADLVSVSVRSHC